MAEKKSYYFNPKTLTFEKEKVSVKEIVKRLLWFLATSISFAILVLWIAFYIFDSPKEKILQKENNQLKKQLEAVNNQLNVMNIVLQDIHNRDDEVYRTIFEAEPLSLEQRFGDLYITSGYDDLTANEASKLLTEVESKMNRMILQLAHQSKSLDTVMDLAESKADMLASIPTIRPLRNMYSITSGFGKRYHPILKTLRPHTGIDISAPKGTPVYATADGTVTGGDVGSGYGISVMLNHGYSYQTVYAHLSKKIVRTGQKIKRGQIIGYVGNTGLSFGPHLHYEVIKGGAYVNPVHYFFSDITPEEYEMILKSSKEVNQALS